MSGLPRGLTESQQHTAAVVHTLGTAIKTNIGDRYNEVIGEHTTFILTGSGGRGEMTEGSDIDGYVVRVGEAVDKSHDPLILEATRLALTAAGLPTLDRGGKFLEMKAADTIVGHLGSKEDDSTNAFTLRMLFLLESQPLMGDTAYEQLFKIVSDAYRNTAAQHAEDFLPFFLVNDIIRYWRTVLLNHEDRLRKKQFDLESEGVTGQELATTLLAHRKYRSQKLRFPRCLTCFSTLAYLLALASSDDGRITAEDERKMFGLTPIDRLQAVGVLQTRARTQTEAMIGLYANYMERTSGTKKEIVSRLGVDAGFARATSEGGLEFTKRMFDLIQDLGQGNRLHRQMLI